MNTDIQFSSTTGEKDVSKVILMILLLPTVLKCITKVIFLGA